ncbi:phytanoyl-CoA dioxygenase family protein [Marinoscillum luteum]|uniref:Phytanoyl-CoA dioxygenase family protein n=1 Tax=Marinoscillum luteum TaxID=861051 RepID=A0ABW7N4Z9_9BACT
MMNQEHFTVADLSIDQVVAKLEEFGLVVIPNYLGADDVEKLFKEFYEFTETEDTPYKKNTPYSEGVATRVKRLEMDTERFKKTDEVFGSQFMREITDKYWSKEAGLNEEIFVVKDVLGSKHVASDLHFDVKPTLKYFIYLNDTTAENGAFSCVPGSHKVTHKLRQKHQRKLSYKNRELTRELPVSEEDVIPIEGRAGTLIIFSTEVFHKAGNITKGERYVMRGHSRTVEQDRMGDTTGPFEHLKRKLKSFLR